MSGEKMKLTFPRVARCSVEGFPTAKRLALDVLRQAFGKPFYPMPFLTSKATSNFEHRAERGDSLMAERDIKSELSYLGSAL